MVTSLRNVWLVAAVVFLAAAIVHSLLVPGVSFLVVLLVLAGAAYGLRELVTRLRAPPTPARACGHCVDCTTEYAYADLPPDAEPSPGEQHIDGEAQAQVFGTPMGYDETLAWLLARIGRPVGVVMRARYHDHARVADAPAMRAKGRLERAEPDELADQTTGERLEFRVGRAVWFSIGEVELEHAERADDLGGALLYFEGALLSIATLREEAIQGLDEPVDVEEDSP